MSEPITALHDAAGDVQHGAPHGAPHGTATASTPVRPASLPGAHPLLSRLVTEHGADWVTLADLGAWQHAAAGPAVLLVAGDAVRFPEGLDVAVVLPELRAHLGQPWRIGVAMSSEEDAIASRFGAQRRPSLIVLRDGRYATTVAGMHDWTAFVTLMQAALAHPTGPAPLAIHAQGGAPSSCH